MRGDRLTLGLLSCAMLSLHGCGPSPATKAPPSSPAPIPATVDASRASSFAVVDPSPNQVRAQAAAGSAPAKTPRKKRPAPPIDFKNIGMGAVIDLSGTPAGALFEAKTVADKRLQWVERTQIQKVLREQNLQALFSAEAGRQRAGLGKLLKADLLLLLRSGVSAIDKKEKYLELLVCETECGLRLAAHAVPMTPQVESDVAELETVLTGALAKLSEKITDVCAVPPFLNQDLDYRFNHLAAGYARMLAQHLSKRKGVLLVELAEAQSLAQEAALSGGNLERRLPLYFLGEFRNEGKGDDRRVWLSLRVERGQKPLASRTQDRTAPGDVAKVLPGLADELAEKLLAAAEAGELDPEAEIEQLTERSRAFERLGNYAESLALMEAAILLDPDRPELRHRASHVTAMVATAHTQNVRQSTEEGMKALHVYRRAIEHLEIGIRPRERRQPPVAPNIGSPTQPYASLQFEFASIGLRQNRLWFGMDAALKELFDEVAALEREALLRICRARGQACMGDEHRVLAWALDIVPRAERLTVLRKVIEELKDLPFAAQRTEAFLAYLDPGTGTGPVGPAADFLEELSRDPHPAIRDGAARSKKQFARNVAAQKAANERDDKRRAEAAAAVQDSPTRPINLIIPDGKYAGKEARFGGCVPLSPGIDLIAANDGVFLMRQKGVLQRLLTFEMNERLQRFDYDGRYAWISTTRYRKLPRLYVLDAQSEKLHELTADDGLPLATPESLPDPNTWQRIDIAALGPGRAMLVGSFGRTWLALATFDGPAGREIKVFHEAREVVQYESADVAMRTTVAFEPSIMFVLGSGDEQRVLVGRGARNAAVERHPLVVDARAKRVEVLSRQVSLMGAKAQGGYAYLVLPDPASAIRELVRLDAAGTFAKTGLTNLPEGFLVVLGNDVFIADRFQWLRGSLSTKEFRPVAANPIRDPIAAWGLSHHYGFLFSTQSAPRPVLYQVTAERATEKR